MRQFRAHGIILNRTDYGEADRIITFLTPDHGKVRAIAKGVRRSKSKLAGGIELFSVSDLSFIAGKNEINTLRSSRLVKHYANIVKDLDRTDAGYSFIQKMDKATEEAPEPGYFYLLQDAFGSLDDNKLNLNLIILWFDMQLLRLGGHTPNLRTDDKSQKLLPDKKYSFDAENMRFRQAQGRNFSAGHIKFLRLGFSQNSAATLNRVKGSGQLATDVAPIVTSMLRAYIRI